MLISTVILFALAGILGIILITRLFKSKHRPRILVYSHGTVAATALVLLIIAYLNQGDSLLMTSILVFIVAALGGFIMFGMDTSEKAIPRWLPVAHGLAAVTGLVLLLIAVLG